MRIAVGFEALTGLLLVEFKSAQWVSASGAVAERQIFDEKRD